MSAQRKLNISSIIGIKEGIYQVFSLIDQNLDTLSEHPDKINSIKDCKNYIHQLDGLLEMLGLSSITVVSEKMEQIIDALLIKKIEPTQAICDALKESSKALRYYINELIDGKEENPLRLFPPYRSLMQVYGYENAPESDLFFPRLTANPAFKAESTQVDATTARIVAKQLGGEFQASLLKWLRDPSDTVGLQRMAQAVGRLEEFPGATEERAFWWVASGFLQDLLQQSTGSVDVSIRRLCGKIEQAIRYLVAGTPGNTAPLLRELLYHIAHSESDSQHIMAIKNSYAWPGQVTEADLMSRQQSETLQPILDQLRTALMQTNDIWREFCAGQQESLVSLQEYTDWLKHLALQTECSPLVRLIDVIGDTVAYLHQQPQDTSEELAMEMATALLLVESIIDDFNHLSADLPAQIDTLALRLQQITTNPPDTDELINLPAFSGIDSKSQENELLANVAQQIHSNLAQVETILDKFFFEPSQRSELSTLKPLFDQMTGALTMLDLERANTLLDFCWELIGKLFDPDYAIVEAEQILLVDGLSSLGFFIEAFKSGQPDSHQIIEEAINLFEIALESSAPAVKSIPETKETIAQPENLEASGIDPELLAIFLEEAEEVLAGIANDLDHYRTDPANQETLADLRRAFHTLKGSGRMVKLDDISEVAWNVEQVLNHWLSEKKAASAKLLELIDQTQQSYLQWCKNLREHGASGVEAAELLLLAQGLLTDGAVEERITAAPAQEPMPEAQPGIAAASAEIVSIDAPAAPFAIESPVSQAEPARDHINLELLPVFLEETHDIVPQIGSKLRAWRILPQDEDIQRALLRLLHTLKGSARMAGALQLGELIHAMESDIESAFSDRIISEAQLDQLETEFDAISGRIEQLQTAEVPVATSSGAMDTAHEPVSAQDKTESLQSRTILRINSELIDRLVNDSGEASILRSKIEAQLTNFKQSLQDLAESTHRLHDQLREVEIQAETHMQSHLAQQHDHEHAFDPLEFDRFSRLQELTRLMAESVDDIITVQKSLRSTHTIAEEAVAQQSVINRQLQQSLMQIRTVPFSNFSERYYRIARQVAENLGKKAQLEIIGADVEIDRNVLEKINPSLEHLLRNAIAHGIEEPAQRLHAKKSETGRIMMHLRQESNEVIITLSDDGRGLNLVRIRKEAQRLGLVKKNEAIDDDKIMALIFSQGLSTTDSVTGIAGRGIGLDIVKNEISMLGGRISVNFAPNQGTTFTIYLPLMLSVAQTLMVRAGKQVYAIPAFIVEHHREFDADTLKKIYHDHHIDFNGKKYQFSHLAHLLGESDHNPEFSQHDHVLFLHSGTQHLAIHVDELISNTEVVVKNTGAQMAQAPGIEGATLTGDGEIILILNPVKLMQRQDVQKMLRAPLNTLKNAGKRKLPKTPTVMVVDDSLTVRKVTCRLLEREGCDVLIAKNGVEALALLKDTMPNVMLVDLEMPKMNGFELIKNIRNNPKTAHIAIIIISSRTAEKHRKIAKDLGVDIFLGKPYKEDDLLQHLSNFIQK
ncbi:hybrid sensor histidine kinase/response regulator [Nitrosomonas sp. JL21]|uniref:hybrid sensor histidine kinase/response regulator n=1 Tax=Nitrosomonas sp. JL21 TaxID=153949 RepID=UPI00136A612F|nr:Hpt domain-containing protein [Nitrosomonas sp. JL21]MBL8497128.1 Hpt domain-containing protein [Nitrosomonas sp.]MXS76598.1 hybrid sensor histidine kinase/response regulator [Nitrosomonas sp. JL21]